MYLRPHTIEDALDHVSRTGARIVAGGTDLYPALGEGLPAFDLVDLGRIEELGGIGACPEGWLFGARTTWSELLAADLPPAFDGLKAAAREVGSVQIQNRATLVGNLCNASPAADGLPPLMALGANVILLGPRGTRRMQVARFVKGPRRTALRAGEIVMGLHVPAAVAEHRSAFLKLGARRYLVISIAMVAATLRLDRAGLVRDARVAVGACSPAAKRLRGLEAALEGMSPSALQRERFVIPAYLRPLSPVSDVRGSAAYRRDAVAELCRRAVLAAVGRAEA